MFKRPSKFNAVDHCSIIEMHFSSWFNRFLFDLKRWKTARKYLKTPKSVKCFKNVRKRIWNVPKTIENIKKTSWNHFFRTFYKILFGKIWSNPVETSLDWIRMNLEFFWNLEYWDFKGSISGFFGFWEVFYWRVLHS